MGNDDSKVQEPDDKEEDSYVTSAFVEVRFFDNQSIRAAVRKLEMSSDASDLEKYLRTGF